MWFPKTVIHAFYALCYLSRKRERTVPASEVAQAMLVPAEQAAKVLQALASANLIVSRRGRLGGYQLIRDLDEMSVAEVFDAFDAFQSEVRVGPRPCPVRDDTRCTAFNGLMHLATAVRATLAQQKVATVVGEACEGAITDAHGHSHCPNQNACASR